MPDPNFASLAQYDRAEFFKNLQLLLQDRPIAGRVAEVVNNALTATLGEVEAGQWMRASKLSEFLTEADSDDLREISPQIATMSSGRRRNLNAANGAAHRRLSPSQVAAAAKTVH